MSKVGIIGGGIVGMCTAWYLRQTGHDVVILDKGDMTNGCSWGNAGMIVPSHFVPLSAPGMISKGIRWMFNSKSPFYIRPRIDGDLFRWGWNFYKSATSKHVDQTAPALRDLSLLSKNYYQALASRIGFELNARGLLMLYRREETEREEMETVKMAHRLGMEARALSLEEVRSLEPNISITALGGIYFPGDMHLSPSSMMSALQTALIDCGVQVMINNEVERFRLHDNKVTGVETSKGFMGLDQVVLAAGSWSQDLARQLHLSLPVQAGKGYSFVVQPSKGKISIPTLLLDDRVAVTPLGDQVRFGGTMEIGGLDNNIDMKRVEGIVDAIPRYYPDLRVDLPSIDKVWYGFRPCSPDGLPFIGRSRRISNLLIATGHGMMGVSLGPATGRVIADLINNVAPAVSIEAMNPDRFN